jgi:heat shock protein HslJ
MQRSPFPFVLAPLLAAAMTGLPGCAHDPKPGVALLDTEWRLIEIHGAPPAATAEEHRPSLKLSAQTDDVEGSGGCNRFATKYQHDGIKLGFDRAMATKMGCDAPINQLESAFFDALQTVATHRVTGDRLELLDAAGRVVLQLQAEL